MALGNVGCNHASVRSSDNAWATGLTKDGRLGDWAVPWQYRIGDGEAVRLVVYRSEVRSVLRDAIAPRVRFLWAESELRQDTARFENVRCCVPGQDVCRSPFDRQAAVRSVWHE